MRSPKSGMLRGCRHAVRSRLLGAASGLATPACAPRPSGDDQASGSTQCRVGRCTPSRGDVGVLGGSCSCHMRCQRRVYRAAFGDDRADKRIHRNGETQNGEPGHARLRSRRLRGQSIGLPCEPGRRFCQYVSLQLEAKVLSTQFAQLLELIRRRTAGTQVVRVEVSFFDLRANRWRRRLKLLGQLAHRKTRSSEFDDVSAERVRVRGACFRHDRPSMVDSNEDTFAKPGQLQPG